MRLEEGPVDQVKVLTPIGMLGYQLYGVPSQSIITFDYFGPANALKVTIPRRPQGSIGETDMHAA